MSQNQHIYMLTERKSALLRLQQMKHQTVDLALAKMCVLQNVVCMAAHIEAYWHFLFLGNCVFPRFSSLVILLNCRIFSWVIS